MNRITPIFIIALIALLSVSGMAQDKAARLERIDKFVQSYVDNGRLNGAVVLIEKDGRRVYEKTFGYRNVDSREAMSEDAIFRIASMTKPVISVAAMILYEEGLFSLDDPVSKFIPEFTNPTVVDTYNENDTTYTVRPASREITVRDLLSHSSGLGYAQIGDSRQNAIYYKNRINGGIGTPYSPLSEMIPKLAKLPLMNDPGSVFLYGLNTDVLGYFVEVVSGQPLDAFIKERIFDPLGMKDTYFYLPESHKSRLVPLYKYDDKLAEQDSLINLKMTFHRDYPLYSGEYFSGGAGLSSTAEDYMKFARMLLQEGKAGDTWILAPQTVRMMHTNQIGDHLMWGDGEMESRFGLGFGIFTRAAFRAYGMPEGAYGWSGMYASHFWVDPANNVTVVIMRNIWPTPDWDLSQRIVPVIYQALTVD
ncbi:serine hydrolase domain-containing protein [Fulvivirga sedimenti]|uniref:Beta-lactamase family protein n=1 Tax=Fulvivirga sedimenti TaxID=2879465 RepID=A0A9X1HPY8_9BACT|nr:serine hydrolase domain-containing protein [Fulvivirga sedimenti]MCA6074062.1 beta-lactamase family protein [Fulvivirga sedimenti]